MSDDIARALDALVPGCDDRRDHCYRAGDQSCRRSAGWYGSATVSQISQY